MNLIFLFLYYIKKYGLIIIFFYIILTSIPYTFLFIKIEKEYILCVSIVFNLISIMTCYYLNLYFFNLNTKFFLIVYYLMNLFITFNLINKNDIFVNNYVDMINKELIVIFLFSYSIDFIFNYKVLYLLVKDNIFIPWDNGLYYIVIESLKYGIYPPPKLNVANTFESNLYLYSPSFGLNAVLSSLTNIDMSDYILFISPFLYGLASSFLYVILKKHQKNKWSIYIPILLFNFTTDFLAIKNNLKLNGAHRGVIFTISSINSQMLINTLQNMLHWKGFYYLPIILWIFFIIFIYENLTILKSRKKQMIVICFIIFNPLHITLHLGFTLFFGCVLLISIISSRLIKKNKLILYILNFIFFLIIIIYNTYTIDAGILRLQFKLPTIEYSVQLFTWMGIYVPIIFINILYTKTNLYKLMLYYSFFIILFIDFYGDRYLPHYNVYVYFTIGIILLFNCLDGIDNMLSLFPKYNYNKKYFLILFIIILTIFPSTILRYNTRHDEVEQKYYSGLFIYSNFEKKGFQWIKDKTNVDDVILCSPTKWWFPGLSGRSVILTFPYNSPQRAYENGRLIDRIKERMDDLSIIYTTHNDGLRCKLLDKYGIKYLILSKDELNYYKRINKDGLLSCQYLDIVYSNKDITILNYTYDCDINDDFKPTDDSFIDLNMDVKLDDLKYDIFLIDGNASYSIKNENELKITNINEFRILYNYIEIFNVERDEFSYEKSDAQINIFNKTYYQWSLRSIDKNDSVRIMNSNINYNFTNNGGLFFYIDAPFKYYNLTNIHNITLHGDSMMDIYVSYWLPDSDNYVVFVYEKRQVNNIDTLRDILCDYDLVVGNINNVNKLGRIIIKILPYQNIGTINMEKYVISKLDAINISTNLIDIKNFSYSDKLISPIGTKVKFNLNDVKILPVGYYEGIQNYYKITDSNIKLENPYRLSFFFSILKKSSFLYSLLMIVMFFNKKKYINAFFILRMARKALITGVTGQDGSYLSELLLSKNYEVHGVVRKTSVSNTKRIDHIIDSKNPSFFLHYADMTDSSRLSFLINKIKPDEIYNLAALSHVKQSFEQSEYTGNVTGLTVNRLLTPLLNINKNIKFYQASSSELFGDSSPPQNFSTTFSPRSPYAASKLYAYNITDIYRKAYNMYACNGILFNHESPRRGTNFVTRKITKAVSNIYFKKQKELRLGNINSKRDWGYAPDYVEAIWRILQQDEPKNYLIGTGESYSVKEFVEKSFNYVGLDWEKYIIIDEKYYRPLDNENLVADKNEIKKLNGWKPKILFTDLVKIMIDADFRALGFKPIGEGDEILVKKYPNKWWFYD